MARQLGCGPVTLIGHMKKNSLALSGRLLQGRTTAAGGEQEQQRARLGAPDFDRHVDVIDGRAVGLSGVVNGRQPQPRRESAKHALEPPHRFLVLGLSRLGRGAAHQQCRHNVRGLAELHQAIGGRPARTSPLGVE